MSTLAMLLGVLEDLAAAGTLGAAVLAGALLVSPRDRVRTMAPLAVLGAAWTLTQLLALAPVPRLLPALVAGIAALITLLAVGLGTGPRARGIALLAGALAVAGIVIRVLGDQGTDVAQAGTAVPVLVHVLAMSLWVGGLGAIVLLRARGPLAEAPRVIGRFSRLAVLAWCVLALSGLWALLVRVGSPMALVTTAFGLVGLAKAVILLVLGALGARQRRLLSSAPQEGGPSRPFLRLAVIELVLMVLATALGALLSLLPAAGLLGAALPTGPAAQLTGHALPPAPSVLSVLAAWRPDALILAVALVIAAWAWAAGPSAARAQAGAGARADEVGGVGGDRALAVRVRVVVAAVLLALVCCGALGVYAPVLSSAHLLQQGLLLVLVGPLLASSVPCPGALARLLRQDPWTGPLLALGPLGLLVLVHATPWLLGPGLSSIAGHELLLLAPVALGALTWWVVDPRAHPGRHRAWSAVLAALPVAGLAASGLALALGSTLLAPDRFGATGRTWRADALADQQTGGWLLLVLAGASAIVLVVRAITTRRRTAQRG